jgi:hypothetical protein
MDSAGWVQAEVTVSFKHGNVTSYTVKWPRVSSHEGCASWRQLRYSSVLSISTKFTDGCNFIWLFSAVGRHWNRRGCRNTAVHLVGKHLGRRSSLTPISRRGDNAVKLSWVICENGSGWNAWEEQTAGCDTNCAGATTHSIYVLTKWLWH